MECLILTKFRLPPRDILLSGRKFEAFKKMVGVGSRGSFVKNILYIYYYLSLIIDQGGVVCAFQEQLNPIIM